MSSETITRNDLTAILNEVLPPTPSEYKKLLWTNPSPTSSFSAQTISLDLSNYDEVEIEAKQLASGTIVQLCRVGIGKQTKCLFRDGNANNFYTRTFVVSASSIQFGDAYYNSTVTNTDCVPIAIYGIKYERVAPPQLEADIETLATDITIIRVGNLRVLKCKSAVYSTIKSITLATSDRPSTTIEFTGIKHAGGMYATLGLGYIETTGKITAVYWGAYSGSAYPTNLVNSDNFTGDAIWYVTE